MLASLFKPMAYNRDFTVYLRFVQSVIAKSPTRMKLVLKYCRPFNERFGRALLIVRVDSFARACFRILVLSINGEDIDRSDKSSKISKERRK